ncbi:hypothetical protein KR044_009750 [Drosophila immigrans]|nr:hypothetical protein KR044_009750 [Drosophila immigrans]
MEAQTVYIKVWRLSLKSASNVSKRRLQELTAGIGELRQLLSCVVCRELLRDPYEPVQRRCGHHVCRLCVRGRKRLKPGCEQCQDCFDFKTYKENKSMAWQMLCYRTLCNHLQHSLLFAQLAGQRPSSCHLYNMMSSMASRIQLPDESTQWFICEGANYNDMCDTFLPQPDMLSMHDIASLHAETPPTTAATTPELPFEQHLPEPQFSLTDIELEAAATGDQYAHHPLLTTAAAVAAGHQQPIMTAGYIEPSWTDQVDLSAAFSLNTNNYATYVLPSGCTELPLPLQMPAIGQVVQLPLETMTASTSATGFKRRHAELLAEELEQQELIQLPQKPTIISSVQVKPPSTIPLTATVPKRMTAAVPKTAASPKVLMASAKAPKTVTATVAATKALIDSAPAPKPLTATVPATKSLTATVTAPKTLTATAASPKALSATGAATKSLTATVDAAPKALIASAAAAIHKASTAQTATVSKTLTTTAAATVPKASTKASASALPSRAAAAPKATAITRSSVMPKTTATAQSAVIPKATVTAKSHATSQSVAATTRSTARAAAAPSTAAATATKIEAAAAPKACESPIKELPTTRSAAQQKLKSKEKRGCRCGTSSAPGKATCRTTRCACYMAGLKCVDCKCNGCKNPHTYMGDSSDEEVLVELKAALEDDIKPKVEEAKQAGVDEELPMAVEAPSASAPPIQSSVTLVPVANPAESQHPVVAILNECGKYQYFNTFNGSEPIDPVEAGFSIMPPPPAPPSVEQTSKKFKNVLGLEVPTPPAKEKSSYSRLESVDELLGASSKSKVVAGDSAQALFEDIMSGSDDLFNFNYAYIYCIHVFLTSNDSPYIVA